MTKEEKLQKKREKIEARVERLENGTLTLSDRLFFLWFDFRWAATRREEEMTGKRQKFFYYTWHIVTTLIKIVVGVVVVGLAAYGVITIIGAILVLVICIAMFLGVVQGVKQGMDDTNRYYRNRHDRYWY